ncbi:MAG: hypothetical protein NC209_04940 [Alistipes sp.]|nr:hypothetical protein [Alistipes senegalensis]MCM1250469.1 hypothetical protein [Alistipes sp.]
MRYFAYLCMTAALTAASCANDDRGTTPEPAPAPLSEEYYAGGELGTAFNTTSAAFEQPTPVVDADAAMTQRFLNGEQLFENVYHTGSTGVRCGLGPLYIRTSCIHCHPGYGHGKRQTGRFDTREIGNGYLLVVTDAADNYLTSLTGMPQTQAVAPFKAPIDESQIAIAWHDYTDEWGNRFPDGESYSLIYPEVTIPEKAYYVPLIGAGGPVPYAEVKVRVESTIGIFGTGLLDAIDDDDLLAEYVRQEQAGAALNPAVFADGKWTKTYGATAHPLRYTYALSRGPLQDGAGVNAMWNITNVTRGDRRYHYMTAAYAETASKDPEVQAEFYDRFPERNRTGDVEKDIYDYLMNKELPAEMSDDDFVDFMVWHRGLAVPAARNLDDEEVRRGKELFTEIGCAYCHRPTWTTGEDRMTDPNGFFEDGDSRLPRYPRQKIWPYTDMVQHRLFMKNDIRTGWCRTTPLWGRGLHRKCTGSAEADRLHDCRARTVLEAIMWHGAAESDARRSVERFRELSKADREAVAKFIDAI